MVVLVIDDVKRVHDRVIPSTRFVLDEAAVIGVTSRELDGMSCGVTPGVDMALIFPQFRGPMVQRPIAWSAAI